MRRVGAPGLVMSIAVLTVAFAGCMGPSHPPEATRAADDIYGLSLTLDLKDTTGSEQYYSVDRDGVFGFGGGMNARFEKASYTTTLSSEDMQRLLAIVNEQRLLTDPLTSGGQADGARYELRLRHGKASINKTIKGVNPRVDALRALLQEFANRRLDVELEIQPKASVATQPATRPD